VIIEKTPENTDVYDPDTNFIVVTNHFQSNTFLQDPLNMENMQNETSVYRYERIKELITAHPQVTPGNAADILRDYKGLEGKNIGLGNEKAVNQFIAHHSVIFEPEKRRIWVAGPPYQLGEYWLYQIDSLRNSAETLRNSAETLRNSAETLRNLLIQVTQRSTEEAQRSTKGRKSLQTVFFSIMNIRIC
jgi:hypothetical protein